MEQNVKECKRLDELPAFFSMAVFSDVFGVSRATAYRMAEKGDIPCLRIGKRIILSRDHIKQWVDQMMEV